MTYSGRIESVYLDRAGGEVTADAPTGTQILSVGFPCDFDETGGMLQHEPTAATYAYTAVDIDGETVTLAAPLPAGVSFTSGDMLYVYPLSTDARAVVRLADSEDEAPIDARISHALRPLLPEGLRDIGEGESVVLGNISGGEWFVTDLVGQAPVLDGSVIDPSTLSVRSIGGITTSISSTAPAAPVAGDLWIDSSAGNQINQFDGTAWNPIVFNGADVLAANTITASQLAAGLIIAGIVDGTTISGGTLIADGSNGKILVYSGTPASGNLIGSMSPVAGSDAQGNATLPGWSAYASVGGVGHAASLTAGQLAFYNNVSWPSEAWPSTAVATINFNDANLDTTITTVGDLLINSNGLTQQASGSKLANSSSLTYPVTITGTADTSIGFMTVPAANVEVGASYQMHASGSFSTGGTAPSSATFGVWWNGVDGTQIGSLGIPELTANQSGSGWDLDAEINFTSLTECEVSLRVGWHTSAGIGGSVTWFSVNKTSGLTNDTAKNLSLGFKWGSAPSGTNFLCDVFRAGRIA